MTTLKQLEALQDAARILDRASVALATGLQVIWWITRRARLYIEADAKRILDEMAQDT